MPEAGTEAALRLLGLAHRAGRAVIGTRAVLETGSRGGLAAVVVARDATENAVDRLRGVLRRGELTVLEGPDRAALGRALGREQLVVVGVTDAAFARKLARRLPSLGRRSDADGRDRESGTLEHAR